MKKKELTIDIVDDDASVCRALARLLRAAGYRDIVRFHSAEDFLDALGHRNPALLILDLLLPGMNGLELLSELRSLGIRIPVILISSHEKELERARSSGHDPVAFLPKPFEERELLTVIRLLTP
ncbi:MAG: response regulator [Desulfomonilia bacterium]|jgi:FixJ family two-component response regulator